MHPTMKPVELVERAINNSSKLGDIVLDGFGGSGSTLIAAVKTGRIHKIADGKIDVDAANKEWFMNTDPAKLHKTDPLFENPPEAMPVGGGGTAKQNFSTFQQAKTADVNYRAMLAKAKLKMITGETIDRNEALDCRV